MRLGALVAIVARLFAVIAHNICKVFSALRHLLALWARRGGVGTANRCSPTLDVGHLPAILHCVTLLDLLDLVVVDLSLSFVLVKQDIVSPVAPYALHLFGLEGLQFYCKLLELVLDVK